MLWSSLLIAGIVLFAVLPCRSAQPLRVDIKAEAKGLSAGGLLLRELTQPPGLFVWTVLRDLEALDAVRLRTLARDIRELQRGGSGLGAAPLVMEAATERDLAGVLSDLIANMQLESKTTGPRSNVESDAAMLACRMARRDWRKLQTLLENVPRDAGAVSFWLLLAADLELPPAKVPSFLTMAARGMEERHLPDITSRVLWTTVKYHGAGAAAKALKTIRNRSVRTAAEEALRVLKHDPPLHSPQSPDKSPALKSPGLRWLLALDTALDEPRRIPFPLLRAVLRLSPEEALSLATELPRDPAPPGHWLAWMLFMRATEGDAAAAAVVAVETGGQLIRAGQPAATLFALRQDLDAEAALREIRDITSPDAQRQALSGFLTSRAAQTFILAQQGNPLMALASQTKLPAASWRAGLCQAAAAGGGEAALQLAQHLPWESPVGRAMLQEDIIKAWALTNLPSLRTWAAKLTNPDELQPVSAALAFVEPILEQAID